MLPAFAQTLADAWSGAQNAMDAFWARSRRQSKLDPDLVYEIPFEQVELKTQDGLRLSAWYVAAGLESKGRRRWTAVIHHYFGGQKASALEWIRLLHGLGVDVLAFDGRGHGGSDHPDRVTDGFGRRVYDVEAAVGFLQRHGRSEIVGVGQSQGAAVMAMAAARLPSIRATVFESGPAPDLLSASWGLAGVVVPDAASPLRRLALAARIQGVSEPLKYPWLLWSALLKLRSRPLLWIHGDADPIISQRSSRLWYQLLSVGSSQWQGLTVPGAGHVVCLTSGSKSVESAIRTLLHAASKTPHGLTAEPLGAPIGPPL
jgi:uncharacterized protein